MSTPVRMAPPMGRLIERVKQWWASDEGSWRGPFFGRGFQGNWYQLGALEDGFQRDLRVDRMDMQQIPVIASLRHLHRSAFAQLRPHHYREDAQGAITDLRTSAPLRVMLNPNEYESGADFNARMADEWMTCGEALIWGVRNDRFEVAQMHLLPRSVWRLVVEPETQALFYVVDRASGDLLKGTEPQFIIPSRDVLHLRWATPRHPLIGESGFAAAGLAAGIQVALSHSQAAFFSQMRRPSGILSTDQQLTKDQIMRLREAYDAQAKGMASGGVPILASGLKWQPMSISSEDAEVIAALRMSNEEIARCVGVPGPLIGDLEKSGLTNTEALIEFWLSISLGGLIERYEWGLNRLLSLDGRTEWVDMSTEGLLRTNLVARMDGLTKGVQGGVLSPNEARKREGLSPVDGGDQVFLQRQNTPVDLLGELAAADLARKPTEPTGPPNASESEPPTDEGEVLRRLAQIEIAGANARASVAEILLQLEQRGAALKDGRDGVDGKDGRDGVDGKDGAEGIGICAVAQTEDLSSVEFEFTNAERHVIALPTGPRGEKGESGVGLDAPAWAAGVYRAGVVVQHYEGRTYRAIEDTHTEPGDSPQWQRLGMHGQRWCGPLEQDRAYEAGDLYVDGGTFLVLASGVRRCLAAKPLPPSEVRAICAKQIDEVHAQLRSLREDTAAQLTGVAQAIEVRAGHEHQSLDLISGLSEALGVTRQRTEALSAEVQELRARLDERPNKGGRRT